MSLRPSTPTPATPAPTTSAPRTTTAFRSRTIDDGSSVILEPIESPAPTSFVSKMLARSAANGSTTAGAILTSLQNSTNPQIAALAGGLGTPAPAPFTPPPPAPAPATFTPPPPAPTLPPVSAVPPAPIPNASGAGATNGIPPWMTLLSQMPQFGGMGSNAMGGGMIGMGSTSPLQGQPFQNPFSNINFAALMPLMSSFAGRGLSPGQGMNGAGGVGTGVGAGGARVGGGQAPALQGQQGLAQLLQSLAGQNATRFTNTFGGMGQGFPFAPFLQGGANFGQFSGFNPAMMGLRSGMSGGGFGMTGSDPRANDMRQLLLQQLMGGGGMMGGGVGGGLDVG